jgi:outer membrane protein TolC
MAKENELLRVQIELSTVQDRLDGLNQIRPTLSAKLSEALGRVASEVFSWPQEAPLPPAPPPTDEVLTAIRRGNPDLNALDYRIESRANQVKLARMKGYPDFTVGIDYTTVSGSRKIRPDRPYPSSLNATRRLLSGTSAGTSGTVIDLYSVANMNEPMSYRSGGRDNIMFSIKVNVPVWRKRIRAGIEESKLMEKVAEGEKQRKNLSLDSAAHMALFGMKDALRRFNFYEDSLLPKAQQSYESLQSAFGTGDTATDFLDLLDSIRLLLDFELEQIRAARDLHISASKLELILGGPWIENESK